MDRGRDLNGTEKFMQTFEHARQCKSNQDTVKTGAMERLWTLLEILMPRPDGIGYPGLSATHPEVPGFPREVAVLRPQLCLTQ